MTEISASSAPLGDGSEHYTHALDKNDFAEVSFASTATEDLDADNSATPFSSTTSKGKQPMPRLSHNGTNGFHVEPGSSLTPIDETAAAGPSSYVDPYTSSASAYLQNGYEDQGRYASPDLDEAPYSPTTYPPISEEEGEARRVQQNLERWAAEERQRRKAQRTSKIVSNRNSISSGTGGLAHRISILRPNGYNSTAASDQNNLGAGPSSERLADGPGDSPSIPYTSRMADRSRDTKARRASGTSSLGGGTDLHRPLSSSSLDSSASLGSEDHRPNKKLPPIGSRVSSATHFRDTSGGSARSLRSAGDGTSDSITARDPFRDPSDGTAAQAASGLLSKRSSLKPTPTASRPIVTVGRASSIQRRALESGYNDSKGKGKGKGRSMPTIVATDTEAEAEDEDESYRRDRNENPFASSQDSRSRRIPSSTTIHEGGLDEEVAMEMAGKSGRGIDEHGDIGESTLDSDGAVRPLPARTSTSSSKFRELGISAGDDWIESVGPSRARKMRVGRQAESSEDGDEARKPWWSDLLCGCSRDYDDDEQVSARDLHLLFHFHKRKLFDADSSFFLSLPLQQAGRTNPME